MLQITTKELLIPFIWTHAYKCCVEGSKVQETSPYEAVRPQYQRMASNQIRLLTV